MPDHDKSESTPDYASMFANFMPGQSQPPQAEQPPANQSSQAEQPPISESADPQPQNAKPETDDFLAAAENAINKDEYEWKLEHAEELANIEEKIKHNTWAKDKSQEEIEALAIETLKTLKKVEQYKKKSPKLIVISIIIAIVLVGICQLVEYNTKPKYKPYYPPTHNIQQEIGKSKLIYEPSPTEQQRLEQQRLEQQRLYENQQLELQKLEQRKLEQQAQAQQEQQQQAAPQMPLEEPDKLVARLAQKNRLNVPSSAMLWASVESGLALPILKTAKTNDIAQALSTHTKKRCQTIDSRKTSDATDIKLLYCVNSNGLELDSDANFNTVWHQTFHAQTQDNIEFIEMYLSFAPSSDKSARIYKINHDYATVSEFRDVYGGDGEEDRISFKIYDIAPISWLDTQAIRMRIISDVSNSNETTGCFYENEHKNLHSYIFAGTKFRPVADWLEISVSQNQADCEGEEPSKGEKIICQSAVLYGKDLSISKDTCQ